MPISDRILRCRMIAIDARQKALMDHEHRQLWRLIAQVWGKLAARCELLELPISPQGNRRCLPAQRREAPCRRDQQRRASHARCHFKLRHYRPLEVSSHRRPTSYSGSDRGTAMIAPRFILAFSALESSRPRVQLCRSLVASKPAGR
jgi:hypothetical protein